MSNINEVSIPFKRERHSEQFERRPANSNTRRGFNSLQTGKTF